MFSDKCRENVSGSGGRDARLRCAWSLNSRGNDPAFFGPGYRGAFEPGEKAPRSIRFAIVSESASAARARFSSSGLLRRGIPFAMSVDINPEFWKPLRQNRAWFFFQSARSVLGLWCSLPVTWLAQKPDGSAIPPPWRELWSFGTDHCWAGRMGAADEAERFIEECIRDSPQIPSLKYRPRIRVPEALDSGLSTRQEQQA